MRFKFATIVATLLLALSLSGFSQSSNLIAYFPSTTETITPSNTKLQRTDTIIIPKQTAFDKDQIKVYVDQQGTNINLQNIEVPINSTFVIDDSKNDTFYYKYSISVDTANTHESWLTLKLVALDTKSDTLSMSASSEASKKIYVERYDANGDLTTKKNYEFWMFIGTNIDLVDGIQAQDLYFRSDYLTKLGKDRSWMFISLGKSRYFDNSDSITNGQFTNVQHLTNDDTTKHLVTGYFNGVKTIKTDNLFCSLEYLWRTSEATNKNSKFFITAGLEVQYLTITSTFSNVQNLSADTAVIPADSFVVYHPLNTHNYNEWNYNASLGFMHILDIDGFDIKTKLLFGLNYYQFADSYLIQGLTNTLYNFNHEYSFYSKFSIDATVLNPGISLGFEVFASWRKPNPLDLNVNPGGDSKLLQPLFNISLTKVFNLNHLKSLFSGVSTVD